MPCKMGSIEYIATTSVQAETGAPCLSFDIIRDTLGSLNTALLHVQIGDL